MDKNKPTKRLGEQNQENELKVWFNQKFLPTMAKIGNQRHLGAIRDAFGTMIPIIIAGSLGVLINAIIFGGAGSGNISLLGVIAQASHPELSWDQIGGLITGGGEFGSLAQTYPGWQQTSQIAGLAFGHINTVTVGMMSIWFSFLFGYYIAVSRNFKSPIIAGLVSTTSFLLASLGEVAFFMDAKGLIAAIIFGIIATEFFIWLSNVRALNIKLPDGVPPAVGKSFQVFLPAFLTLAAVGALNIVVLAPAIVTGDLAVTGTKSLILQPNKDLKVAQWGSLFGPNNKAYIDKILGTLNEDNNIAGGLIQEPRFAGYESLLKTLATNFQNMTQQQWNTWYETLSVTDQAVVASSVATLMGTNLSTISSIDSNAIINLVSDGAGSYIVTIRWMGILMGPTQFGISAAIYQFITSWFISFATGNGGLGIAILYVFLATFFWFFGIHGTNVIGGIFTPIFQMILGVNLALVTSLGYEAAADTGQMGVFAASFFDSYAWVGGSGGTLGLLSGILFFSKRRELKEISKFALPAGVFQINEPVMFGVPIVLNPVYAVPYILVPMFSLIVGYIFSPAVLGFVKYSYVQVPWTAPWFLGAVLTSIDARALVPAIIVGAIAFGGYIPFILLDNYLHFKKMKKNDYSLYQETMRYYNDPKYKFETDTQSSYEAKLNKVDISDANFAERIDWWTKKLANKDANKLNDKINQIQAKSTARNEMLNQKAEAYKAKREASMPTKLEHWEEVRQKRMAKFEEKEARLAAKTVQ